MGAAFTLVELLVVVAVLAILASMLFPVFGQAREQAKRAQDISNLRQCAHAIFMYRDDNGNRCVPVNSWGFGSPFFGAWHGPGRSEHDMPWPENVQPYAKSWGVFRCPADPNTNDEMLSRHPTTDAYIPPTETALRHWAWAWRSSYGLNYNWLSYPVTFDQAATMKNVAWSSIGSPARTILLVDSIGGREVSGRPRGGGSWAVDAPAALPDLRAWLGGWRCYYPPNNGDPNSPGCKALWNAWGGCFPFFSGGQVFNLSFADGHASGQRLGQLIRGVNPFQRHILDLDEYQWDTIR
ncbi:MAG: prepilin-type N-terminal cleavage/methylation domain-containing protein [Fimbriimonadia bacterium]